MSDTDIAALFQQTVKNIGLVALIISTCAFILAAARDAYDMDLPESIRSPTGGPSYARPPWRYMSDDAQRCREKLRHLAIVTHAAVLIALGVIALGFFAKSLESLCTWLGSGESTGLLANAVSWWKTRVDIGGVVLKGLQWTFMLTGPAIIWFLAKATMLLTNARDEPLANKPPPQSNPFDIE